MEDPDSESLEYLTKNAVNFTGLTQKDWKIIDYVRAVGQSPVRDVARQTGISFSNASKSINDLIERGLLINTGRVSTGRPGPPTEVYRVNPEAGYLLGISIEREDMLPALLGFDFRKRQLDVEPLETGKDADTLIRNIRSLTYACLEQISQYKLLGVGFSWPGAVNIGRARIGYSPVIPLDVHSMSIEEMIKIPSDRAKLGTTPVVIESDMHALAIAEREVGGKDGRPRDETLFACVIPQDYLRVGFVIDGRVYRGVLNSAGYIGGSLDYHGVGKELGNIAKIFGIGLNVIYDVKARYGDSYPELWGGFDETRPKVPILVGTKSTRFEPSRLGRDAFAIGAAISAYHEFTLRS